MRIVYRIIFAGLLVIFIAACTNEKKDISVFKPRVFPGYHVLLDEIVRSPEGVFRGLNLNTGTEKIKQIESGAPAEEAEGHIYYEYKADSLTDYSIDYTFNKDSLEEISIQIKTKDMELSSYLFCDLKDFYATKLPNPKEDKGYVVYNCFEGQRRPFVVSLSDDSSPTQGIINMVIYKDK